MGFWTFGLRKEREEVTGCFSAASLINQFLTPISDSWGLLIKNKQMNTSSSLPPLDSQGHHTMKGSGHIMCVFPHELHNQENALYVYTEANLTWLLLTYVVACFLVYSRCTRQSLFSIIPPSSYQSTTLCLYLCSFTTMAA